MTSFCKCEDLYCSPCLVSIICAMACHFLRDNDIDHGDIKFDAHFLRAQFLEEARYRLRTARVEKLTTVQTYAIMSIVDIGSGKGRVGTAHLRLATDMMIDRRDLIQCSEAESISAWGI